MTNVSRRQLLVSAAAVAAGLSGVELLRTAPARAAGLGCGGFPSTYPSVLRTSGQNLVDAKGNVMPRMRGFNVQPVPWPQTTYDDMAKKGASLIRTVVFWDELEKTQGVIGQDYIKRLDEHINRVQQAKMYTVINFYFGPDGNHMPGWATKANPKLPASCMSNYIANGQFATQHLAKRYGDPSNPLHTKTYTPIVAGFGINEPTPDESTNDDWLVTLLGQQATGVGWFRAYAPAWIALLSCGFGATAPLPNALGSGHEKNTPTAQSFTGAPLNPLSQLGAQGGNFMLDLHDYFKATTAATKPHLDGRKPNGQTDWTDQGGTEIRVKDTNHPNYPPMIGTTTMDRGTCQKQQTAFLAPYVDYCAAADVPLCVGEWGWIPTENGTPFSGGDEYIADKQAAWASANAAIEVQWDYGTDQAGDPYAARPGKVWQLVTDDFFMSC